MKYCDRGIMFSTHHYGVCVDEKAFKKELRRLKVPAEKHPPFLHQRAEACVHSFENSIGKLLLIVCIGDLSDCTNAYVCGVIAHEATHVWQFIKETIGETNPSWEFEAYAIQNITTNIMEKYEELTQC